MKRGYFRIVLSVVLLACSSAGAQKIITFDAPRRRHRLRARHSFARHQRLGNHLRVLH